MAGEHEHEWVGGADGEYCIACLNERAYDLEAQLSTAREDLAKALERGEANLDAALEAGRALTAANDRAERYKAALDSAMEEGYLDHIHGCQYPYGGQCSCGYLQWQALNPIPNSDTGENDG